MTNAGTNSITGSLPAHFDLGPPTDVSLLRSWTNDVYLVETTSDRFVLKLYGVDWRTDSEIRYEIDLLDHLAARGVRVARAIRGVDGDALRHLDLDGRQRQAVLFRYADGAKPQPPFSAEMYYPEGMATAELHRAADDFTSTHHRRPLDLDHLIDQPLALVGSLDIDTATKQAILDFGARLRERIEAFADRGLDWGVCHGDLTFDNFHLTHDGETVWYDFDSGGPGWRAIDLQGWAAVQPDRAKDQQAFLRGYREVRPLGDNDIAASPHLAAALELWGLRVDLERRIIAVGDDAVQAFLGHAAERLNAWRKHLRL
ncbi:MAG: phosphotransferase [Chloroflexota bacterium]|jgi:Ser/Thr protein kinase RdoA (MazF antagonist)|nr:phosphotransferase [Chloroflexota bacterium]